MYEEGNLQTFYRFPKILSKTQAQENNDIL
jgi:hypothetical protein